LLLEPLALLVPLETLLPAVRVATPRLTTEPTPIRLTEAPVALRRRPPQLLLAAPEARPLLFPELLSRLLLVAPAALVIPLRVRLLQLAVVAQVVLAALTEQAQTVATLLARLVGAVVVTAAVLLVALVRARLAQAATTSVVLVGARLTAQPVLTAVVALVGNLLLRVVRVVRATTLL
jgi:hypothetical protein